MTVALCTVAFLLLVLALVWHLRHRRRRNTVNGLDDFPAPVDGRIQLEHHTTYRVHNPIKIPPGESLHIVGATDTIVYVPLEENKNG